MINMLITGHKGLIGKEVYDYFDNEVDEMDVYGYDRDDDVDILYEVTYDYIIHCAANCVIREVIENPHLAKENIDLTTKIMDIAQMNNSQVVMFSSNRVSSRCKNPYIVSKRFNEDICKAYRECYGINYMIIRPETVWGINDNKVRVMPTWINRIKNNKDVTVYGDKSKELNPVYVDDFVHVFLKLFFNCMDKLDNKTYTITGKTIKCRNIVKTIKSFYRSNSRVKFCNPETSQPQKHCIGKNEIQVAVNLTEGLLRYDSDIQRGRK